MSSSIIWIGMDVHKDTVMVAVFEDDIGRRLHYAPIHRNAAITAKIHSLMRRLKRTHPPADLLDARSV